MLVKKLLEIAQVGGSAVLYVLLGLSVISIGVIVDRAIYFLKRRIDVRGIADRLGKLDRAAALALLKKERAVEAQVVAEAIDGANEDPEALRELIDKGLRVRRKETEAGLLFLGTLGNNAPFVGLFGTVLGIVTAFRELSATTANAGSGGGMGNVMSGIAEALVATAVGILVALPAVIAYNVFAKKAGDLEENAGALGNAVIASIKARPVVVPKNGASTHAAGAKHVEA
jgi:biopolymer transport protein ExbB/TolQ